MGKTVKYQDSAFDKKAYWDRRNKGYSGQIPALGSPKQRNESRRLLRLMQAANLKDLRKGKHER